MEYNVIYSKRKTVSLKVASESEVVVHAPYGLSRKIIDEIINKHSKWIEKRIAFIKNQPLKTPPTKDELEELKERTKAMVLPLVEAYAHKMGVKYERVSITNAKKVFGSCTSKKHLNFSFRLCLYPKEAIEYVVVHELCHLKEMNHSKKFWSEVEAVLPDYRERRKLLK